MANNKYNLSKEYQFDITVTDNTYAGKLALPYVTAAVKSPDTVAKGYVRQIDGLNRKAVISNLGINDPIVAAACSNDFLFLHREAELYNTGPHRMTSAQSSRY